MTKTRRDKAVMAALTSRVAEITAGRDKPAKTRAKQLAEGLALVNVGRMQRGLEPLTPKQWAEQRRGLSEPRSRASKTPKTSMSKPAKGRPQRIDVSLKAAIRRDGRSHYAIATAAGVTSQQIGRFMLPDDDERHRGISLETAAALAVALGLELRTIAS